MSVAVEYCSLPQMLSGTAIQLMQHLSMDNDNKPWLPGSRSQYIRYNGVQSESAPVLYGVPQGSVLGPVLFILYSADVISIATRHMAFFSHSYADDLQIYDHSSQTTCLNLVPRMSAYIEEISTWMASNRLKLNPSKTEVI